MECLMKFIGKNKSMGLIHGKRYRVDVTIEGKYIWVRNQFFRCPYQTPFSFNANWRRV